MLLIKHLRFILLLPLFFGSCSQEEETAENRPPNILFAISDDQSFPHTSAYGCTWVKTPAFDRVAQEGLLFQRAYTPNPKCSPSRSCILTGRNSWQLEEAANHWPHFPEKFKTFTEVLGENGYAVGRTGKGWAPGRAKKNGKPRKLIGTNYSQHKLDPPAKFISDLDYAANFQHFLDSSSAEKPFFFWYGAIEPHRRYEFGAGINKGGKKLTDIDQVPGFWPDIDSVRTDLLDYAFEIEHFDQHLETMLQLLEERGLLENTIVVVTSDNGMPFPRVKGQMLEMSSHLPLAIRWGKGIKNPGRIIEDYVNFIDFAPTFLEVAGLSQEESNMQAITGKSLTDIFFAEQGGQVVPERNFVLIGKERHDVGRPGDAGYPVRGIIKDGYLYRENFEPGRWPAGNPETGYLNCDGSPTKTVVLDRRTSSEEGNYWTWGFGKRSEKELYHIAEDPYCLNNVVDQADLATIQTQLKEELYTKLKAQEDPRILGNGAIFDTYEYSDVKSVNFYERYMKGEELNSGWVNPTDFETIEEATLLD